MRDAAVVRRSRTGPPPVRDPASTTLAPPRQAYRGVRPRRELATGTHLAGQPVERVTYCRVVNPHWTARQRLCRAEPSTRLAVVRRRYSSGGGAATSLRRPPITPIRCAPGWWTDAVAPRDMCGEPCHLRILVRAVRVDHLQSAVRAAGALPARLARRSHRRGAGGPGDEHGLLSPLVYARLREPLVTAATRELGFRRRQPQRGIRPAATRSRAFERGILRLGLAFPPWVGFGQGGLRLELLGPVTSRPGGRRSGRLSRDALYAGYRVRPSVQRERPELPEYPE